MSTGEYHMFCPGVLYRDIWVVSKDGAFGEPGAHSCLEVSILQLSRLGELIHTLRGEWDYLLSLSPRAGEGRRERFLYIWSDQQIFFHMKARSPVGKLATSMASLTLVNIREMVHIISWHQPLVRLDALVFCAYSPAL